MEWFFFLSLSIQFAIQIWLDSAKLTTDFVALRPIYEYKLTNDEQTRRQKKNEMLWNARIPAATASQAYLGFVRTSFEINSPIMRWRPISETKKKCVRPCEILELSGRQANIY